MYDNESLHTRREIGVRMRQLRKNLGLTQSEVAEALGHSSSYRINQIELARIRLYAEELPKLIEVLKCSLSDIVPEDCCPYDR